MLPVALTSLTDERRECGSAIGVAIRPWEDSAGGGDPTADDLANDVPAGDLVTWGLLPPSEDPLKLPSPRGIPEPQIRFSANLAANGFSRWFTVVSTSVESPSLPSHVLFLTQFTHESDPVSLLSPGCSSQGREDRPSEAQEGGHQRQPR